MDPWKVEALRVIQSALNDASGAGIHNAQPELVLTQADIDFVSALLDTIGKTDRADIAAVYRERAYPTKAIDTGKTSFPASNHTTSQVKWNGCPSDSKAYGDIRPVTHGNISGYTRDRARLIEKTIRAVWRKLGRSARKKIKRALAPPAPVRATFAPAPAPAKKPAPAPAPAPIEPAPIKPWLDVAYWLRDIARDRYLFLRIAHGLQTTLDDL